RPSLLHRVEETTHSPTWSSLSSGSNTISEEEPIVTGMSSVSGVCAPTIHFRVRVTTQCLLRRRHVGAIPSLRRRAGEEPPAPLGKGCGRGVLAGDVLDRGERVRELPALVELERPLVPSRP